MKKDQINFWSSSFFAYISFSIMKEVKRMKQQKSKAQQIRDMYSQGAYIWQIARALDITEAEVVATLGLG